jgi:integrase
MIVDELHTEFSIALFEKYLHIGSAEYKDVFSCFDRKIQQLRQADQINTAVGYNAAKMNIESFTGRTTLAFQEVDKRFLQDLENHMIKKKKSLTTVGIYMRYLRTIFNEARDEKLVNMDLYPFGRNKYQIPQPANNKRALGNDDLVKIFQYQPEENTWEEYAKDMWTFSLLCQGMNMKDISNLRYKNIQDDKIIFIREKTKRTKKSNLMPIVVYINDTVREIIQKWGIEMSSPNQFIFPICSDDASAAKNLANIRQQIKMINKYIRQIATSLKIKQDVTFYEARHSFATTLKRQGRSIEEIQEFLGHTDKKTTERYLASFGDGHKRSIMNDFVQKLKTS